MSQLQVSTKSNSSFTFCLRVGAFLSVFLVAVGSSHLHAACQQGQLGAASSLIKNAEADIKSAQGSAGTPARPAKGSRLKLTKMRLNSAKPKLEQAGKILDQISADDTAAAPLRKRHEVALANIANIEKVITPGAPPTTGTPGINTGKPAASTDAKKPAAAGPKTKKLDYKQEKLLKDARWYVRETEKYCGPAATCVKKIDAGGPQPLHGEVKGALASIQKGIPKFNLAVEYIQKLPAAHPDVVQVRAQIQQSGNTMKALQSRLQAVSAKLQKITGMENYPAYTKDYQLIGDLAKRYGSAQVSAQQPENLARVITEDGQALKEFQRIAKTYQALADQKTDDGLRMEKRVIYALNQRKKFAQRLMTFKKTLPGAFDADLAEVEKMAKTAVENKQPAFFGEHGGIAQRFGWAEDKLIVIRAFGADAAKPFEAKMATARKNIKEVAKSLEAQIIATNSLPPDNYKGGDRESLIKLAISTWKKQQSDAEILGARIPSQAWNRNTRWQWSNSSFYKVDTSKLQIQLLIKHDENLAVIRPINLYKNHMKGDTLTSSPFKEFTEELQPRDFLVRDKIN